MPGGGVITVQLQTTAPILVLSGKTFRRHAGQRSAAATAPCAAYTATVFMDEVGSKNKARRAAGASQRRGKSRAMGWPGLDLFDASGAHRHRLRSRGVGGLFIRTATDELYDGRRGDSGAQALLPRHPLTGCIAICTVGSYLFMAPLDASTATPTTPPISRLPAVISSKLELMMPWPSV